MRTAKLIVSAWLFCSAAYGDGYLVAPFAQTGTTGGPEAIPTQTKHGYREQEIVGSDQFTAGPIVISQISFRAYPGTGPVNATSPSLSLYLSTTSYYPNTTNGDTLITTTYANNTGPDNTLVYSGPVSFTSPGCAGPSVCPFDMFIVFSQPFSYNPNQGRLLLDFQYGSYAGVSGFLDNAGFPFPPGGSVAQITGGARSTGSFSPGGHILLIGYTLPATTCDATGSGTYPCPIGGTVLLLNPPAGTLFKSLGANSGVSDVSFIEDPQNPGIGLTTVIPLEGSDFSVPSLSETFNFATVSRQPAIAGLTASITCGVTGAGAYSLAISLPGQLLVLNCPNLSVPGTTATVTAQANFAALSALTTTFTLSGSSPTANDSIAFSGFVFQLQVPSASPGCTYVLDHGGNAFSGAAGEASVSVTAAAGCDWSVLNIPSWVVVYTPTVASGSGVVKFGVLPNPGGDRSATLSIANLSFTIDQQPTSLPGLNFIGSMPHFAAGNEWKTEFTVVNKGAATATARLTFFGDPGGPVTVPIIFPQEPPAPGPELAVSFDRSLAANATLIVDTAVTPTPPAQVGSANLTATGTMDGFAIFHSIPGAQEAVVPVQTRNAPSYLLAFDNTGGVVLGAAIENLPTQAASVGIVIRDDTGALLATDSIPMDAQGHKSFVLPTQYPVTANIRGTIEFDTPPGGQISVLGIRATPLGAGFTMTTVPPLDLIGTNGGSFAHIASGTGWQTTFVLVNTGAAAAQATLNFFSDVTGAPLPLPLSFPQAGGGGATAAPSVSQMLPAGATWIIESAAPLSDPAPTTGSAQLKTNGNVGGFVIFRFNPNGQEAVVPLENRNANAYLIAFDNTAGTVTGIGINSVSTQAVQVPLTIRDDTGTQIATDTLSLAANGHLSFTLDNYPATANIRGTIEFTNPPGAQIGVIGIRAPVTHTFTTLPALAE